MDRSCTPSGNGLNHSLVTRPTGPMQTFPSDRDDVGTKQKLNEKLPIITYTYRGGWGWHAAMEWKLLIISQNSSRSIEGK